MGVKYKELIYQLTFWTLYIPSSLINLSDAIHTSLINQSL